MPRQKSSSFSDLKDMDVDALLQLRAEVDKRLVEQTRDLQRKLSLLDAEGRSNLRGRPAGRRGRPSGLKGTTVPPKFRGPNGETWAGRGAKPRWLTALLRDGHSIDEFAIGSAGKSKAAAAQKATARKRGSKRAAPKRPRKPRAKPSETPEAAS